MVHVPLIFLSEWREFPSAPCLAGKKNLMAARVSMLLKSRVSPDMLPCSLCKKKTLAIRHMSRPVFPTALSIPSYDIGNQVGLRTYQNPLVMLCAVFICCSLSVWISVGIVSTNPNAVLIISHRHEEFNNPRASYVPQVQCTLKRLVSSSFMKL